MSQQEMSGKWKEIKGEIRNQWSKLTDDDLERAKGNVEAIAGVIQQRYGHAVESTKEKLRTLFGKFSNDVNQSANDVKRSASEGADKAKRTAAETTENMKRSLRETDGSPKHP